MRPEIPRTSAAYEVEHRRNRRWGLAASVLVHVLLVLLFTRVVSLPISPHAAAGPRSADDRAAAGGGLQVVNMSEAQAQTQVEVVLVSEVAEAVPVPEPVPEPQEIEVAVEPTPARSLAMGSLATGSSSVGPLLGPGTTTGTGRGDGGDAEEGRFRLMPPSPRGLILPPSDRPRNVRGREFEVWVFVAADGRVVSDSTRLNPGTGDARFDRRLRDQAAQWVFEPARQAGRPVAAWFQYVIEL
jgi:hypothetical protein